MAGDIAYEVQQSDCLSKIAKDHGFTWKKLWDYGPNAELKAKRKNPNILMPGDVVYIPKIEEKKDTKDVDKLHKFKRKKEQALLRVQLLIGGTPLKEKKCTLVVQTPVGKSERPGKTDKQGNVEIEGSKDIKLPGDARLAWLRVGEPPNEFIYRLSLGELSPYDEVQGIQQRLNNLGYNAGLADGKLGPRTKNAIVAFQRDHDLKIDGIAGQKTQEQLKKTHGC